MKTEMIFAGYGGQGILLLGQLCASAALEDGKKVTWIPSYGAEMRGGTANCAVVISDKNVGSPLVNTPDILVVMNEKSCSKFGPKVKSGGIILQNASLIKQKSEFPGITCHEIPATDLAAELGDARAANIVMLGAVASIFKVLNIDTVTRIAEEFFSQKYPNKPEIARLNRLAAETGFGYIGRV